MGALADIRMGLDKLSLGLEKLRSPENKNILTVTVSPAFAATWLLPRFESFQARCPDIDLRLDTNLKPIDFTLHHVDIGVRYGSGRWPELESEKLMDEEVYPVCSPGLFSRLPPQFEPKDVTDFTLIHDLSMDGHIEFPTWERWLLKACGTKHDTSRNITINNSAAVLQAAANGRGIALARSVMAQDDVKSGRLIRLFPEISFKPKLGYYIVYKKENMKSEKLNAFKEWIINETECASSEF